MINLFNHTYELPGCFNWLPSYLFMSTSFSCFWDTSWFDLVHSLWYGSDINKKRIESDLLTLLYVQQSSVSIVIAQMRLKRAKLEGMKQKQPSADVIQNEVLKNFVNFTGKHLRWSLFLIKLQTWKPATLLKETSKQFIFCEICEIFENTFFYRTPPVVAFVNRYAIIQTSMYSLACLCS